MTSGTFFEARTAKVLAVALLVGAMLYFNPAPADGHPQNTPPVTSTGPTMGTGVDPVGVSVTNALRALAALRAMGYQWTTDAGADRAIRHWQRVNGLAVDGIVGPRTLASLGLPAAVVAGGAAPVPVPASDAAPAPGDACAEMRQYRQAAGLPEQFDAIGYRESRCRNTAISRTGCCVGALQLHQIIFRDHRMIDRLAACGATWTNVRGDTPESWQRQMCAAKALWEVVGMSPWSIG